MCASVLAVLCWICWMLCVRCLVYVREDILVSPDLSQDPTLGRVPDWRCPACGNLGCVFFQLPERVAEDTMTLVYVCTKSGCGYSVKQEATQEIDVDAGQLVSRMEVQVPKPHIQCTCISSYVLYCAQISFYRLQIKSACCVRLHPNLVLALNKF